jgi:riboflavin kinase/FMN adenylyltransferase
VDWGKSNFILASVIKNYPLVLPFMVVHKNIEKLPVFRNAVVTIGTFDGVHLGHRQILRLMREEAARVGGETVLITFFPHPRQVIASSQSLIFLLNTPEEKARLLDEEGIAHLVVVPFTEAFSMQEAIQYINDFLVKKFSPHTIIIGHDHRFGKSRLGDITLLRQYAPTFGYVVLEIPEYMMRESVISSTLIRQMLQRGDMRSANSLLGYRYGFSGTVVRGDGRGRLIGYPTANIEPESDKKMIPGNGVYAVSVQLGTKANPALTLIRGMMNIGIRPTFEGTRQTIEVNLFDFEREIYGEHLHVTVVCRLRNEQKFTDAEELKNQLASDRQAAMLELDRTGAQE